MQLFPMEVTVPNSTDKIVLESPDREDMRKAFRNISRVDMEGNVIWIAELPEVGYNADAYVSVGVNCDVFPHRLVANTFSCYQVELNWDTGKVESIIFTK